MCDFNNQVHFVQLTLQDSGPPVLSLETPGLVFNAVTYGFSVIVAPKWWFVSCSERGSEVGRWHSHAMIL